MKMREIMQPTAYPTDPRDPEVQHTFRHGYCMFIALALWEMGAYTIVGTVDDDTSIDHVWAKKIGTDQIVDITGVHSIPDNAELVDLEDRVTSHYWGKDSEIEDWAKAIIKTNPEYFGIVTETRRETTTTREWRVWFRERTGTSYLGSLHIDARSRGEALRKAKAQLASMYLGNTFKLVIMDE